LDLKRLAPRTIQNFGPLFAVAILAGALIFWFDQKTANATTAKIGSCYQLVTLGDIDPPSASRDLYVLVDQTMTLPKKLQEETYRKIIEFLRPGDVIQIIGFSANAAGFYTEVILKEYVRMQTSHLCVPRCLLISDASYRSGVSCRERS